MPNNLHADPHINATLKTIQGRPVVEKNLILQYVKSVVQIFPWLFIRLPARQWQYVASFAPLIIGGGKRWLEKGSAFYQRERIMCDVTWTFLFFGSAYYWPGFAQWWAQAMRGNLAGGFWEQLSLTFLILCIYFFPMGLAVAAQGVYYRSEFIRLRQLWVTNVVVG